MFLKKHNWDIDIFLILINALFAPRVLLYLMFFSLRLSIFYDIDHFCCDIFLRNRCFWYFLFWDAIFNVLGLCVMNLISFFFKNILYRKKLLASAGFELRLSEEEASTLTTWPRPRFTLKEWFEEDYGGGSLSIGDRITATREGFKKWLKNSEASMLGLSFSRKFFSTTS